jgi:hypothetical protein
MPPEHEVAGSNPAGRIPSIGTKQNMSEQEEKTDSVGMPRFAVATVVVGLIASLMVIAVDFVSEDGGGSSASTEWVTIEPVRTPAPRKLGDEGSFALARTTLSAIEPSESGQLLFRVAGLVEVESGGNNDPVTVRCDVSSPADGSFIARTPQRRASWPRSSDDLGAQPVPDELVVRFRQSGDSILGLPVRDSFRTFTDSASPTGVIWDGFIERTQNWVWTMPQGTGDGGATLGYAVVFKTTSRPRAEISCTGSSGNSKRRVQLDATQQEWPLKAASAD